MEMDNLESFYTQAWKTDDKEWVKERQLKWKDTFSRLERLKADPGGILRRVKKSDFKFYKNYFLTGRDAPRTPVNKLNRCLSAYNTYGGNANLLMQFWLSADHSHENFLAIKESYKILDEREYEYDWSCQAYRSTVLTGYPSEGKYSWNALEGTTEKNDAVFGLADKIIREYFTISPSLAKMLDEKVITKGYTRYENFEGVFIGYFGGISAESGFNPNNPIRYLLDEYMRWGFPSDRTRSDMMAFDIGMPLVWWVADTPEGRHPVQVEVATELRDRLLEARSTLPKEAQARLESTIKRYETGEFEQYIDNKGE